MIHDLHTQVTPYRVQVNHAVNQEIKCRALWYGFAHLFASLLMYIRDTPRLPHSVPSCSVTACVQRCVSSINDPVTMRSAALAARWAASACVSSSTSVLAAGATATAPSIWHPQVARHTWHIKHFSESPDILPVPQRQQNTVTQQQKGQQSAVAAGSWTPVKDKDTGLTYWWNQQTGELQLVQQIRHMAAALHVHALV